MSQPRDPYERYLQDISKFPRITPEREQELSRTIHHSGDRCETEAAITEIIHANLRLVIHCLKRFEGFLSSPAVRITRMDLIAEGNIGLMKAAGGFNADFSNDDAGAPSRRTKVRFSTYACKCIHSHMRRALKRGRFIRIPEHHFSYWTEMDALHREHGDGLSDELMREKLDVSHEVLGLLKQSAKSRTCMLEDLGSQDAEGGGWHDFIPNDAAACPADETGRHDLRDFLVAEMETLPPRTQNILSRLYFHDYTPTLRELSGTYGISSERCRQVCAQGLNHLRRRLAGRRHQIDPGTPVGIEVCAA